MESIWLLPFKGLTEIVAKPVAAMGQFRLNLFYKIRYIRYGFKRFLNKPKFLT